MNIPENYNLYIITYENKNINYDHKGKVINLNIPGCSSKLGKFISTIRRIIKVREIKKKYNIEKTISFLDNPNIINILSRYKDKVIISIRNQKSKEIQGKNEKILRLLICKIYNKADKIVALSNGVKDDLLLNFSIKSDKLDVIYNPVDIEYINSLKDEELERKYKKIFNDKDYTIITSGRLAYQKGQWYLLRAFKNITKTIDNINLVILGEGELGNELRQMAKNLNIQNKVHFLGFQSNPFKFIKSSDLFVFTSLFEGFGNVITESMACGTIVVSSDCKSGPKEILNPSNIDVQIKDTYLADYGILIPEFDGNKYEYNAPLTKEEENLSKCIINLLNDKELKKHYEEKLFERVQEFDPKIIVNKWCEL